MVSPGQLAGVVATLFDEEAFLSPYGLRSLSKRHEATYYVPGRPGRGGSSTSPPSPGPRCTAGTPTGADRCGCRPTTWSSGRWLQYDQFFGDDFLVEYPTGSGGSCPWARWPATWPTGWSRSGCPTPRVDGPCTAREDVLDLDPAWRDNLQFFEYFHGDLGAGLGASHQTGWTALVADLILDPPGVRPGKSS